MKKIVLLLLVAVFFAGHYAYADNIKLGYVDLIKALNESDSGKKAKVELEGFIRSRQGIIDEKGKEIEKLKGDLEKQSSVLSSDAKKSKEDELERLIREYQRLVADSQGDVKKKEGEFTGEIVKELKAIIDKIALEEGYSMIIENAEGIIIYAKKEFDLTEIVIKKYNASKTKAKDKDKK